MRNTYIDTLGSFTYVQKHTYIYICFQLIFFFLIGNSRGKERVVDINMASSSTSEPVKKVQLEGKVIAITGANRGNVEPPPNIYIYIRTHIPTTHVHDPFQTPQKTKKKKTQASASA